MTLDFSPEDEQLLATLFPEESPVAPIEGIGGMNRAFSPTGTTTNSSSQSRVVFIALLVALIVGVVGVDLALKRANKKLDSPPWLQLSKMVAGVVSFYLTYWSLNYTTQPRS